MRFEWDESKNRTNYRKHAVWFEEAQTVWADSRSIEFFGAQRRGGSISPNRIFNWRAIAVDHFLRARGGQLIRVISARKATAKEGKTYEEGI